MFSPNRKLDTQLYILFVCRGYGADQKFPKPNCEHLETKPRAPFAFLKSSNFAMMLSEELSYNQTITEVFTLLVFSSVV